MKIPTPQLETDFFRFGLCAACMAALAVVCTAWNAGADEPPKEDVERARDAAERAAATEGAMRELDAEGDARAENDGRKKARSIAGAARAFSPIEAEAIPPNWVEAGLDIDEAERDGDKLVQRLSDGGEVHLTIDPDLQDRLEEVYAHNQVPHGGLAVVEPSTGRVRALVSHSQSQPTIANLARKSPAPSASVFKIITAAALIESAGVDPAKEVCYHGGRSRLTESNIEGDPNRDAKCADLEDALAFSINSVMARLTYEELSREDLRIWAERFAYNSDIPFELPVEKSPADIPEDPHERARAAAGFWHTYMSPLHGALIGAAVINEGVMMQPTVVEKYVAPSGETAHEFEPKVFRRVMSKGTADTLAELLLATADRGTARRYFGHRPGFPSDIRVGGKTGTLSDKDPYLGYTWFVGYGEHRDGHTAAVAGLACNTPKWRIKGAFAASEGVKEYFETVPAKGSETVAASEP